MEKPNNVPSAFELDAEEKKRVQELKDYRAKRQKVWYLK
jgi:hypothetical protein